MSETTTNKGLDTPDIGSAVRFWERGRILYNAILMAIVFLWVALTWPHFRPSLTLGSFEAMVVLGLLANLCYLAAYALEIFMQPMVAIAHWQRFRRVLWIIGMLFAMLLENYWIADEIYPAAKQPPPAFIGGAAAVPPATFASNINFPAPLAVLGFLAACGVLFLGIAAALIFWFARKPKFARVIGYVLAGGAVLYLLMLVGFSAGSHTTTLALGQEKYFCEIDCHLAYSIVDVNERPDGRYIVTLRTRFDETTTSPSRPKDAALAPSPREAHLIDSNGNEYSPIATEGTPLLTPLKPAESYTTELEFQIPNAAQGLRLLLNTTPAWPDHLVIGDENSWLHKKTYFAL